MLQQQDIQDCHFILFHIWQPCFFSERFAQCYKTLSFFHFQIDFNFFPKILKNIIFLEKEEEKQSNIYLVN